MTQPFAGPAPVYQDEDEISVFSLASVLVRWRWTIVALGVVVGVLGLAMGLTGTRCTSRPPPSSRRVRRGVFRGSRWPRATPGFACLRVAMRGALRVYVALLRSQALSPWLPIVKERHRWSDRWREVECPLFPGYFLARATNAD